MKTKFKPLAEAFAKTAKHAQAVAVRKALADLQNAVATAEDEDFISNAAAAGLQDEITALADRIGKEVLPTKKLKKKTK